MSAGVECEECEECEDCNGLLAGVIVLVVLLFIALLALAFGVVVYFLLKKKDNGSQVHASVQATSPSSEKQLVHSNN